MSYIIQKPNGKRLSSVYLNDLGYTRDFYGVVKPAFAKLFVFRENSYTLFKDMENYLERKKDWIENIQNDKRYSDVIKASLIKSVNKLDNCLIEI